MCVVVVANTLHSTASQHTLFTQLSLTLSLSHTLSLAGSSTVSGSLPVLSHVSSMFLVGLLCHSTQLAQAVCQMVLHGVQELPATTAPFVLLFSFFFVVCFTCFFKLVGEALVPVVDTE